jgi:predicted transcriptional regulator
MVSAKERGRSEERGGEAMRGRGLPEVARSELEVLKVLWEEGRLSAREVHERLAAGQGWAYSTTRTVLDRMVKKGLLERGSFHGVYLYQPRISRPLGLARLVRDFAERVLELDSAAVLPLFARSEALSEEEVAELSRLLEAAGADDEEGEGSR